MKLNREPNVVDLFCGAGGLSIGFEKAGFNVTYGVDREEEIIQTWEKNHDAINGLNFDLAQKSIEEVTSEFNKELDGIIGGPPCKDFSKTNQKVDLDRNNLVLTFANYITELEPEFFLLENVRQLTTKYDNILDSFYDSLKENYNINHRLIDAADYGVPQHRIRAFVLGVRKESSTDNLNLPKPTHGPDSNSDKGLISCGEVLSDTDIVKNKEDYKCTSKHAHLLDDIPNGMNYSFYTEKLGHPSPKFEWRSRFSDYLYKADPDKPVRTIKAKPGAASGPFHWENRRFTETELKKLQSFPKEFDFSTENYAKITEMIGNSVPPAQSYAIAVCIKKQIDGKVQIMSEEESLNFYSRRRTSSEEYKKKASKKINKLYGNK